jgi:hypothetical protein
VKFGIKTGYKHINSIFYAKKKKYKMVPIRNYELMFRNVHTLPAYVSGNYE